MPQTSSLPECPNLEFLRDQAKRLLKRYRNKEHAAIELVADFHPKFRDRTGKPISLHDTQFITARQYGFPSWTALKQEIERRNQQEKSEDELLVQAIYQGLADEVDLRLKVRPRWSPEFKEDLSKALAGVVDRSVWHRPQYHRIAQALVSAGVECSIWSAARVGLLHHVQDLLAKDPQLLNAKNAGGYTPLQRAALIYGSHPECETTAVWLMEQGAVIDVFSAAAYSLAKILHAGIEANPNVIHDKAMGSTPLNWAVRPRSNANWPAVSETCALLLDAGSDLDSGDDWERGMRPLHHVAEWGDRPELAALLTARGADINATDDIGWTPLDYAVDRKRSAMEAFLIAQGAKTTFVECADDFGADGQAMMEAAREGETDTMKRLLSENPALARTHSSEGATPLHWAAHNGHYEAASLLLDHGADVHAQEQKCWGGTPLHWAAEREPLLVELLLDNGADVNAENFRTHQIPLHYCARCGDVPEVAEMLLNRGSKLDALDRKGKSPLDYALEGAREQVAAVLEKAQKGKKIAGSAGLV